MTEYVPSYWYYDKMKEAGPNSDYNKIRNDTIEECAAVVRTLLADRFSNSLSYGEVVESIRELKR